MRNLTVRTGLALFVTLLIAACDSTSPTNPSSSAVGPAVASPPTSAAKSGGGAPPQVSSAEPSAAAQGTLNLNVTITGKNFDNSAVARFFVTGTTNPGGITVNSTAFVSSKKLLANIDVDDLAVVDNFDVEVELRSNGRKGKGTEKFSVLQKGGGGQTEDTFDVVVTIGSAASPFFKGVGSEDTGLHEDENDGNGFVYLDLSDVGIVSPCEDDFANFQGLFTLGQTGTVGSHTPSWGAGYYAIRLGGGKGGPGIGYGFGFGTGQTLVWDDPECGLPTTGSICAMNTIRDGEVPGNVEIDVVKRNKSGCKTTVFEKVWSILVIRTSNL